MSFTVICCAYRRSEEVAGILQIHKQLILNWCKARGHVSCRVVEMLARKVKLFICTECLEMLYIRYLASCRNHYGITAFVE